jgi:lipoprotein-releasing system permease protein
VATPFTLSVALRQLAHNRGQTLLTIGVVATSVTLIIFISSLINGLQVRIVTNVTDSIPHVRIMPEERQPEALWNAPRAAGAPLAVGSVAKLEQRLRKIEGWQPWLERIRSLTGDDLLALVPSSEGSAVISRETKRIPGRLIGVDPEDYNRIVDIQSNLVTGRFYGLNGGEAAIGLKLATDLGVSLGDRVRLLSAEGNVANATVAGIFDTGFGQVDSGTVFVPVRDAQSLLGIGNAITGFGLKVTQVFEAERIASGLRQQLPFKIESWMQDNERTLSGLRAQAGSSQMIVAFTTLSAGLAIAALMVMAVTNKYREIGILKAMGASSRQILRIFTIQGLLLSSIGALLGTLASVALLEWLGSLKTISATTGKASDLFPIVMSWREFLTGNALALSTGFFASLYPAWRASRVDPIQVIRGQ